MVLIVISTALAILLLILSLIALLAGSSNSEVTFAEAMSQTEKRHWAICAISYSTCRYRLDDEQRQHWSLVLPCDRM